MEAPHAPPRHGGRGTWALSGARARTRSELHDGLLVIVGDAVGARSERLRALPCSGGSGGVLQENSMGRGVCLRVGSRTWESPVAGRTGRTFGRKWAPPARILTMSAVRCRYWRRRRSWRYRRGPPDRVATSRIGSAATSVSEKRSIVQIRCVSSNFRPSSRLIKLRASNGPPWLSASKTLPNEIEPRHTQGSSCAVRGGLEIARYE